MKTTNKLKIQPKPLEGEAWEWNPGVKCRFVETDRDGKAWANSGPMSALRDHVLVNPGDFVVKMPNKELAEVYHPTDFHSTFNIIPR